MWFYVSFWLIYTSLKLYLFFILKILCTTFGRYRTIFYNMKSFLFFKYKINILLRLRLIICKILVVICNLLESKKLTNFFSKLLIYFFFFFVNFENLTVEFHITYVLNMHIKFRSNRILLLFDQLNYFLYITLDYKNLKL